MNYSWLARSPAL